jgi:hypothetical protein
VAFAGRPGDAFVSLINVYGRNTIMSTTARAKTNFPVKPLVAAVALALAAVNAYADPTPNQLPGAGTVTAVSLGTTVVLGTNYTLSGGGGVGTTILTTPERSPGQ